MNRKSLVCMSLILFAAAAVAAPPSGPIVEDFGWCTVELPGDSVWVGEPCRVQVDLKNVDAPSTLQVELQGARPNGVYIGTLAKAEPVEVSAPGRSTFTFTLDAAAYWGEPDPMRRPGRVGAFVSLAPKASAVAARRLALTRDVSVRADSRKAPPAATATPAAAPTTPPEPVSKTVKAADWCELTYTDPVDFVKPVAMTIRLSGIKAPTTLNAHLRCTDKAGKDAMLARAAPIEVKGDGDYAVTWKVVPKEGMQAMRVVVFLAPGGDWAKQTAIMEGPAMAFPGCRPIQPASSSRRPPAGISYRKSWFHVMSRAENSLVEGEEWSPSVEYYLDPSEDWGGTTLKFAAYGPWVDNPDGVHQKQKGHMAAGQVVRYVGLPVGRGRVDLKCLPGKLAAQNGLVCVVSFMGTDNRNWPWEMRASSPWMEPVEKSYCLVCDKPARLFTYAEPVVINAVVKDASAKGESRSIKFKVLDTTGATVASGEVPFTVGEPGQVVPIKVDTARRGVMALETDVEGWGKRSTTFARIPDVSAATRGEPTKFGMTYTGLPADPARIRQTFRAARMLGFSSCRVMTALSYWVPARGEYRVESLDRTIDIANAEGIRPWMCFTEPPPWLQQLPVAKPAAFAPFPFDEGGWREVVDTLARRWKGRIGGWEWLNEIVPGNLCADPVADYIRYCEIGSKALKAADPQALSILAGGLWPRNFRTALLKAGVGEWIDVLPVHYGDGMAIVDAREDVETVGRPKIAIWDDETAQGLSTWDVPTAEAIQPTIQCDWILNNWADELTAGAERIVYFGGTPDPCGNWSYLLADMQPRPAGATVAVFISKLHGAKPLGKFHGVPHGIFHAFERNGKAILIASTDAEPAGGSGDKKAQPFTSSTDTVSLRLALGAGPFTLTDYQGNETTLEARNGTVELPLSARRVFIEGADLDAVKAYAAPAVVDGTPTVLPKASSTVTILKGSGAQVPLEFRNLFDRPIQAEARIKAPEGWPAQKPAAIEVPSGGRCLVNVPITLPEGGHEGLVVAAVDVTYRDTRLPVAEKRLALNVISPASLGNLLRNPGFETSGATPGAAAEWSLAPGSSRVSSMGLGVGLGGWVMKFAGSGWPSVVQRVTLHPDQTYLYSAWIWNTDMHAGSNIGLEMSDGTKKTLYTTHVFDAGENSGGWKLFSCHVQGDPKLAAITAVPTANGKGQALYDNVRLTVYEGTDFAAECPRLAAPVVVDGKLDEWTKPCPLPLLSANQLVKLDPAYAWTPSNLCGAVYLAWDEHNLYVAAEVVDDVHVANETDERTMLDDSLELAFEPMRGVSGEAASSLLQISAASPHGGSGKHTLYRPAEHAGGLTAGHLARDSSVCEIAVARAGSVTTYELRIPFAQLGTTPALGAKMGLAIRLNDNDGAGRKAFMTWGEGLHPAWNPKRFGVVTLAP